MNLKKFQYINTKNEIIKNSLTNQVKSLTQSK
jgi:hypothetical protein